jgi:hypothetical protein
MRCAGLFPDLNAQGALAHSGQHDRFIQYLGDPISQAQAANPGGCQHDGIQGLAFQFFQAGVQISP